MCVCVRFYCLRISAEDSTMQMWEGLIQKAKDGGLDAIDTYVFWNLHEPSPGNVRFLVFLLHYVSVRFLALEL